MKNTIKSLSVIVIVSILCTTIPFSLANAQSRTISQSSIKENITSGATLEKITRFTDKGWQSINVLRIDLSNSNIKVDNLSNKNSLQNLTSVPNLAKESGAIAAINGSFFNWSDKSGKGDPIGPVVSSGTLLASSTEFNKDKNLMATMSINELNQAYCDYWTTQITMTAPSGISIPIGRYNEPYYGHTDLAIIDSKWSQTSVGNSTSLTDVVEMVVIDGKVSEIRAQQAPMEIPKNGYVVITRQEGGQFLNDNFEVGSPVVLDFSTTPNWKSTKMAVTGSAILVKEGQIPQPFSHDTPGTHPRTAIGSGNYGKQLIMVTVDGRQNKSVGMTQYELAELMVQLGAYNAINLDGGGSTTMVARKPGTNDLNFVNTPSDSSARAVANAVGIFSIAPPSELDGLIIDTSDNNVFVNTSREFSLRGYDKFFNPIEIKQDQIKWTASGVKGYFKGNTFYPQSSGVAKIKATYNNVSSQTEAYVLSSAAELSLNNSLIKMQLNQSTSFSITGKDRGGYDAYINPKDVKWSISNNIGKFEGGTFTAVKSGTGYIKASLGNTNTYCAISVSAQNVELLNNFEADNGTFLSSSNDLAGSYEISDEQKHNGNFSGKITYDFTKLEGTRAAYLVFSNNGLPLSPSTIKLGAWVYNTHENPNWLGAEFYDSKGNVQRVYFTKNMDWIGWKYVEVNISGSSVPSRLTRIYPVQTSPVSDSGSIYIDDLSITTSNYPSVDITKIPKSTVPADDANKTIKYVKNNSSFRFSVFEQEYEPVNIFEKNFIKSFADKINKNLDVATFVGESKHEITSKIKKPVIATNTGYKTTSYKDSKFIQLDMNKNGLRKSDSEQWHWLLNQLNSTKEKKVFLFLASSPNNFSDSLEAKLLKETLSKFKNKTGKIVWVFYGGDKNGSYMEDGIKYISTAGYNLNGFSSKNKSVAKYALVTVKGDSVTYEFKYVE